MTADQFIWWLRGYLDSIGAEVQTMPKADVKALRDALDRVGPAPAPTPAVPQPPSIFEKSPLANKCYRCGQPLTQLGAHFCNGALVNG